MLFLLSISETFISAGIWIVSGIYSVASWAFELFLILATGRLVESSAYSQIITNFYIILGLVMLFFLSFTLLKGMVNPEDSKQGTSTVKKVIINLVTSAIIIALLPTIFTFLYDFQDSVIANQNTIGKFFGYGGSGDSPKEKVRQVKWGAYRIVDSVFTAFFNVAPEECVNITDLDNVKKKDIETCQSQTESNATDILGWSRVEFDCTKENSSSSSFACAMDYVEQSGRFGMYTNFSSAADSGKIDFNFLLSLIAGLLLVYVGVSYSFDMALRMIKLVFYQLIAPIPIFARVIPDTKLSGSFNQWLKVTLACYFEVFVRIGIMYFVIFLCTKMLEADFLTSKVYEYGVIIGFFAQAFILMGIIMFMRQAPKLISEVTGIDSGKMKLGIKDKLKDAGLFAAGAGIGSFASNLASGGSLGTALRSAWKGDKDGWNNASLKSIGAASAKGRAYREARNNGATRWGLALNSLRDTFGFDTVADEDTRRIEENKYGVENKSTSDIVYEDANGKKITIKAGQKYDIDNKTAEFLKSKKTKNVGSMSEANEKLRALDTKDEYNAKQREMLSKMEDEADKDFEKGKYLGQVYYSKDGQNYQKRITSEEFKDLQKQGVTFYDSSFSKALSINDVRGTIRQERIHSELSSSSGNMTKRIEEEFIDSLERNHGYKYESFNYDSNGIKIVDSNGRAVKDSGSFTVERDSAGKQVVVEKVLKVKKDKSGNAVFGPDGKAEYDEFEKRYTKTSGGEYTCEYQDSSGSIVSKKIDGQSFAKLFDVASKGYSNVIASEKNEIREIEIQPIEAENKAIDNLIKQHEESKEAAKQDIRHRKMEAEKKYHANNGK